LPISLAKPGHHGVEHEEHAQTDGDRDQGALRVVNDDLVDDHLGEDRGREPDDLDGERCEQDVAPDRLVAGERGNEPAEAEGRSLLRRAGMRLLGPFVRGQEHARLEERVEVGEQPGSRHVAAGLDVEQALAVLLEDERRRAGLEKRDGGQGKPLKPAAPDRRVSRLEAVGARGFDERAPVV
jgi:hypothetical protein